MLNFHNNFECSGIDYDLFSCDLSVKISCSLQDMAYSETNVGNAASCIFLWRLYEETLSVCVRIL